MRPISIVAVGAAFGICGVAILYIYAKSTRRLRQSWKNTLRIVTPLVVFASLVLLIKSYGDVVAAFGGTIHQVISVGFLAFAIVWFAGCLYLAVIFKDDS